ncbi:protein induced by osmotic stress [Scheffersomyces amazonensis]|uniref:protein induced by osmotic stress n=1 Tax=Scheffersomyces amazonensis TaxID=1078765 RepID=UPI00315D6C6B
MAITAFVTGATGFIAQHIVLQLLQDGYRVIGSVRSIEKGESLVKIFSNNNFTYEVIESFEKAGAIDEALKKHPEVTIFLHTASPVVIGSGVENIEKDILVPAIQGTEFVLRSIKQFSPQIERFVFTSSIVATATVAEVTSTDFKGGESTWNSLTYEQSKDDPLSAYCGAKKFAEKAVFEFVEKENANFTVSSIIPVFVFGTLNRYLRTKNMNESAKIVSNILDLEPNQDVPQFQGNFIDVRDVAQAHIRAFKSPEAQGKRFVLGSRYFNNQLLLDIVRKNFPQISSKLPIGVPISTDSTYKWSVDDRNARNILGLEYVTLEKSIVDSINQLSKSHPKFQE